MRHLHLARNGFDLERVQLPASTEEKPGTWVMVKVRVCKLCLCPMPDYDQAVWREGSAA